MPSSDQDSERGRTYELEDIHFEAPNLDVPNPPGDTPYEQYEDYRYAQMLANSGVPATPDGVLSALETQTGVLLAAAGHVAGSTHVQAATPLLDRIVSGPDRIAAVEAAYSLVRLGEGRFKSVLEDAARPPMVDFLSALPAAGYLAQLNDPTGFKIVQDALSWELMATRMLACKQLYFFVPFHGQQDRSGEQIDVLGAFEQALGDEDSNVQYQALTELRLLQWASSRSIIEDHLTSLADEVNVRAARELLERLPPATS
jgi:hypothetical protein